MFRKDGQTVGSSADPDRDSKHTPVGCIHKTGVVLPECVAAHIDVPFAGWTGQQLVDPKPKAGVPKNAVGACIECEACSPKPPFPGLSGYRSRHSSCKPQHWPGQQH